MFREGRGEAVVDETEGALDFTLQQLIFEEWWCCVIFIIVILCLEILSLRNCKKHMKKPYNIRSTK